MCSLMELSLICYECRSARHCGTASECFKLTAAENMQISQGFFSKQHHKSFYISVSPVQIMDGKIKINLKK